MKEQDSDDDRPPDDLSAEDALGEPRSDDVAGAPATVSAHSAANAASPSGTASTSDAGIGQGWPSNQPIVVGNPTTMFEPAAVNETYRTRPYRADTVLDGWSSLPFTIRAASMRGHRHRRNGAPRQDDFAVAVKTDPDRLIVAVADGVSGAPQSHIGASTVVRYATQWLAEQAPNNVADTDWRNLVEGAAWALVEQAGRILSLAEVDAEQAELVMATTLTCAVCEPGADGQVTARLVCVGDSGAWILSGDEFTQVVGAVASPEAAVSSSEVTGLPRVPDCVEAVEVVIDPDAVLLIGTDGFGNPLGGGGGEVGALFRAVLGGRIPSIIEFAHALDFSRETFDDDRTLVAIWPNQQSAQRRRG